MASDDEGNRGGGDASPLVEEFTRQWSRYSLFAESLHRLVGRLAATANIDCDISFRAKSLDSLARKLEVKGYATLDDIPDLAGVRIIAQYQSDVDAICSLLHTEFAVVEDVPHGVDQPQAFGYASRHQVLMLREDRATLTEWAAFENLKCEVQVRTVLQHAWASISHSLDYKSGQDAPAAVRRKLFQVAALIEIGDGLFQEFKSALETVRDTYEQAASSEEWRGLLIDVDSLAATWPEWVASRVYEQLASAGDVGLLEESQLREYPDREFLSEIVALSAAIKLTSVGQLADLLDEESTAEIFRKRFVPLGSYSLDYISLLVLYTLVREQKVAVPSKVSIVRHNRSMKFERKSRKKPQKL